MTIVATSNADLLCLDLGHIAYGRALELQRRLVSQVQADVSGVGQKAKREAGCEYLLLCEHDPAVITLGRRGRREDILASPEQLARRGIEVHSSQRGGQVTCHFPGQLVGYPIVSLRRCGLTLRRYVEAIEDVLIATLAEFGIQADRREGTVGVFAGGAKIASIGVAVTRWIAWHGFAMNVESDLSMFDGIVPCGDCGRDLTSLSHQARRSVTVDEVKAIVAEQFARRLDYRQGKVRHGNACEFV